ncbi:MAG: ATP-binding protein, partial [Candidatus Moranbacteria bacterium]|nr:ATP-binding protein [Candidatus Moranbacteria bacterium]
MAILHSLEIKNFRGIKDFKQEFFQEKLVCLVGRGDSGKSTILD